MDTLTRDKAAMDAFYRLGASDGGAIGAFLRGETAFGRGAPALGAAARGERRRGGQQRAPRGAAFKNVKKRAAETLYKKFFSCYTEYYLRNICKREEAEQYSVARASESRRQVRGGRCARKNSPPSGLPERENRVEAGRVPAVTREGYAPPRQVSYRVRARPARRRVVPRNLFSSL